MTEHRIITIGASAGGLEPLQAIVRQLPLDLLAAVFVVVHIPSQSPGTLPRIIAQGSVLPVEHPFDGQRHRPGYIYVAPPDQHMLLERDGRIRLSRGPKENRFRPAIDPLFRSAAHVHGPRVIGVVLSGHLDDGAAGLWAIKHHGGFAIVQAPREAVSPSMPSTALRYVAADHCLAASEIGPLLTRLSILSMSTVPLEEAREMDRESRILMGELAPGEEVHHLGSVSGYVCPECHGALQEIREGPIVRFRCQIGHGYGADSLLAELTQKLNESLLNTQRAYEESMHLLRQHAEWAREDGDEELSELYLRKVYEAQQDATIVRSLALKQEPIDQEMRAKKGR